ncbi:MAG: helix-turn-helix domain-containing protein [Firmicutes bacterium]|nr:helix-turn-helix domain-containing protein [Bacillota bacterium]
MLAIFQLLEEETTRTKSERKTERNIGLSHRTIHRWREGVAKPSSDAIVKISQYFDVSADYLLGIEKKDDTQVPSNFTVSPTSPSPTLSTEEQKLLSDYRKLSSKGQNHVEWTLQMTLEEEQKEEIQKQKA